MHIDKCVSLSCCADVCYTGGIMIPPLRLRPRGGIFCVIMRI